MAFQDQVLDWVTGLFPACVENPLDELGELNMPILVDIHSSIHPETRGNPDNKARLLCRHL